MNLSRIALLFTFTAVASQALGASAQAPSIAGRVRLEARVPGASLSYHELSGSTDTSGFSAALGGGDGGALGTLGAMSALGPVSTFGVGYALDEHWVPSLGAGV